eukprot:gene6960-7176_t
MLCVADIGTLTSRQPGIRAAVWELPYMFWDADAAAGRGALRAHDHLITEKLQAVMKADPPEHTIIAHLLKVGFPSGQPLSLGQLKAEVSIFMGAGEAAGGQGSGARALRSSAYIGSFQNA